MASVSFPKSVNRCNNQNRRERLLGNEHKTPPEPRLEPPPRDIWYYPPDFANDLHDVDLPAHVKQEVLACAWEYIRCVVPQYTNWPRYAAFMRVIVIGTIAEFNGDMVDVTTDTSNLLGYDLEATLTILFGGTIGHEAMAKEYRSFLLITAEKSSKRRDGEIFRRYVNAVSKSPRQWFRMRDADSLARFTIASALACNDLDAIWFPDDQFEIMTEIADILYDAVAYFKHRAEGETNNTFAYVPSEMRLKAFQVARELLWALDVAWAQRPELRCVVNFIRFFGGPIHMMMRRYRFVEESLTIGKPEDDVVIRQTRENFKLWNRIDARGKNIKQLDRYMAIMDTKEKNMFDGLAEFLETSDDNRWECCLFKDSYGAETRHEFGGVQVCDECKLQWRDFVAALPARAVQAFPELRSIIAF